MDTHPNTLLNCRHLWQTFGHRTEGAAAAVLEAAIGVSEAGLGVGLVYPQKLRITGEDTNATTRPPPRSGYVSILLGILRVCLSLTGYVLYPHRHPGSSSLNPGIRAVDFLLKASS